MAIGFMIIDTQNMLAALLLAFSSFTGSYDFFDNGSFLDSIKKKKPQRLVVFFAA